jgi:hypothetical protein
MTNKYGILQSSGASCMFYKEDEDGNQSTFNLFVVPEQNSSKKSILAFIDNEHMGEQNWFGDKDITIQKIFDRFDKWAYDAPIIFELDAQKNISSFLKSALGKK